MTARPLLPIGSWGNINVRKVTQAKGDVYIARTNVRLPTGKRVSVEGRGPTKSQANSRLLDNVRRRLGQSPGSAAAVAAALSPTSTVRELVTAHLLDMEIAGKVKDTTITTYRTAARLQFADIENVRLYEVTGALITEWLRSLPGTTWQTAAKVMRGALKYGAALDVVRGGIWEGVSLPSTKKPKPAPKDEGGKSHVEILTPEQVERVIDMCREYRDSLGVVAMIAADTGLRLGEILAIAVEDIEDVDGVTVLHVRGTIKQIKGHGAVKDNEGKTESSRRTVAVNEDTAEAIADLIEATYDDERGGAAADAAETDGRGRFWQSEAHPLFLSSRRGWVQPGTINSWRRKALSQDPELKGTDITTHTFRRTVATAIAASRGDQAAASQLGHARVSVTGKSYIKESGGVQRGATVMEEYRKSTSR